MRKHGGTPSRRDKHVTLAAISPPGVARGRFVGGQQSGLAGSKPPPLFTREASSCSSQGRRQGEPWGASPRPSAPTYLPTLSNPMVCHSVGSARQPWHIPTPSHSLTSTCWRRWETFLLDDEEHLRKWRGHYLGTEDRNIVEQLGLTEDTENATDAPRPSDHIAATASAQATNAARPRPTENGADRNVQQRIETAPHWCTPYTCTICADSTSKCCSCRSTSLASSTSTCSSCICTRP